MCFFFLLVIYLRESLKDVSQHLQRRLPACLMLVVQLRHHEVQVLFQLPPQRIVQQVFQIDLQDTQNRM